MQLPLALATACVLLLAPPWGVRADDFEDVSPAAMLKAAAGRVPRHVLAVGVEGSGHHLVKSLTSETALVQDDCRPDIFFAWNLADDRAQGRSSEMGHAKAYEFIYPQLDSSVLERILLSVYGGKDVLHNSDSYPMVTSVLTHHPDLIAFAAMTKVTPVLLFLRRNLADAALSGRRRHRKTVAIGAELARVEMEAALIEAQYRRLCEGPEPAVQCETVAFQDLCDGDPDAYRALARAVGADVPVHAGPCKKGGTEAYNYDPAEEALAARFFEHRGPMYPHVHDTRAACGGAAGGGRSCVAGDYQ